MVEAADGEEATDPTAAPSASKTPEEILPTPPAAPSAPSIGELQQIRREVEGFMSGITDALSRFDVRL